jgi:hypothetical protein
MPKPSTATLNAPSEQDASLISALDWHAARDDYDIIEGIVCPDKNNDQNILIIVSSTEFYSVPTANILPQEIAFTEFPQRIWVNKAARVWHCQQIIGAGMQRAEYVKMEDLPTLIDTHLSTREPASEDFPASTDLMGLRGGAGGAVAAPSAPIKLSRNEEAFMKSYAAYGLTPSSFTGPLNKIFGYGMQDTRHELWVEWGVGLRKRPYPENVYRKEFDRAGIVTLRDFVRVFGKKDHEQI